MFRIGSQCIAVVSSLYLSPAISEILELELEILVSSTDKMNLFYDCTVEYWQTSGPQCELQPYYHSFLSIFFCYLVMFQSDLEISLDFEVVI